jgi:citrate lyase beta subunit
VGLTPTEDDVRDAQWVLEEYQALETSGEAWLEVEGRVIDRYEAERARELLDWAQCCAARNREKEEAVAAARASATVIPDPRERK